MTTTREENAALVRRFLTDAVAGGDTDAVETFVTEDVVDRNLVFRIDQASEREATALGRRVLAGTDIDIDIEQVVASGEHVAVRGAVSGTHRESLLDLAPTGSTFTIAYAWFCRIDNGRISAIRSLPDGLGLMQQLGAIPELPGTSSLSDSVRHHTNDTN